MNAYNAYAGTNEASNRDLTDFSVTYIRVSIDTVLLPQSSYPNISQILRRVLTARDLSIAAISVDRCATTSSALSVANQVFRSHDTVWRKVARKWAWVPEREKMCRKERKSAGK